MVLTSATEGNIPSVEKLYSFEGVSLLKCLIAIKVILKLCVSQY